MGVKSASVAETVSRLVPLAADSGKLALYDDDANTGLLSSTSVTVTVTVPVLDKTDTTP